jgi:Tol biopolymer transport system component
MDYGTGMITARAGETGKVDTKTSRSIGPAAYTSWHPSGKAVAYSMNKVMQFFHTARREVRDVADRASDIALYLPDSGKVVSTAAVTDPEYLETYPAWSADGRFLYFSRGLMPWPEGRQIPPPGFEGLQYDLARIAYDIDTGEWGEVETLLSATDTGLSMTQPRPSPDGRYLLFCGTSYGCFPIYHEDADICLLDLETREWRRLAMNSDRQDTWRSWSSNGRWFVFSSKRGNGVVARPHIVHFDSEGRVSKPFVLPQSDPAAYEGYLQTYNVPELSPNPVPAGLGELLAAARGSAVTAAGAPATGASPGAEEDAGGRTGPWAPKLGR